MKKTYILVLALCFATFGFGQTIATIDRENGSGPTATDNVVNMSSVGLTRGSGVIISNATVLNSFSTRNYTLGGDLVDAQTAGDYIEWSASADATFQIALDAIDIKLRRNSTGPTNWQLFYSLDGFVSPGIDVSGDQTLVPANTTVFNFAGLGINSGVSGTLTFRLYSWGATANNGKLLVVGQPDWAAPLAIANPGIRLIGQVSGDSIESDITYTDPPGLFPLQENINYSPTYTTPSGLTLSNSVPLGGFIIRDGGASLSDSDMNPTVLNSIEFAVTNSENIAALAVLDLNSFTIVSEVTTVNDFTTFSGLSLTASDGGTRQFVILGSFKTTVTDNEQIQLTVNNTTTPATGSSLFVVDNAGGAQTSIAGDDNRIEVTLSEFQFDQQPTNGNQSEVIVSYPTLLAVDANSNQDLDADLMGISVSTTPSSSIVAETYDMISGEAVLNNVVFTDTESGIALIASDSGFSGTSDTFDIDGLLIIIAQQNFDNETDWSYTETAFFGTVTDWDTPLGYFGEIALADASPINNPVFSNDILGEHSLNGNVPGNSFATVTFADIAVSGVTNLKIEFDWQVIGYSTNNTDVQYRLLLNGLQFGGWKYAFEGSDESDINDGQDRVKILIPDGNTTVGLQVRLRNSQDDGYSGFDNFRLVSVFEGLTYTNSDGWKDNISPDATTGTLDAMVIDGTYNVTEDVQIDDFIINSGASTIIDFGKSITTNANLVNDGVLELNSISNNYSSLIVNGTISNPVTYNRFVNQVAPTGTVSGFNDFISAPVTNASQTFLALRTANPEIPSGLIGGVPSFLFGPFINSTNTYINYTAADDDSLIASGIGYRTASDTPSGSTFRFVGDVETGTKTIPISAGASSIFNLIGNPYPSYISLFDFLAQNNDQFDPFNSGVYGYTGDFTSGFTILNQAYADANDDALIAPGQGFLVSSTGTGTITFLSSMRSIGTSDDFISGRTASLNLAHLKLQLSHGDALYNTDFYFNDNASLGMDPGYDSALFESSTPEFAIYSHLVENNSGKDMAVQSLSYSDLDNTTIPLGINSVQGVQTTVAILESDIPEGTTVILEDNVSNTFTNLNTSDYTFTPSTNLTSTGRFYLHFSSQLLNVSDTRLTGLEIYTNPSSKTIVIKGQLEAQTKVQLYDIQGRLVSATVLDRNNTEHIINVSELSAGVYVVQMQNTSGSRTEKVILK